VNAPTHVGAATAAVARQMAAQQVQQSPRRQIPASIAAAMANAGVDTSDFDIIPG